MNKERKVRQLRLVKKAKRRLRQAKRLMESLVTR